MNAAVVHAAVAVAGIAAYVTLVVLAHTEEANVVLAAGLAYGSGAGVQRAVGKQ